MLRMGMNEFTEPAVKVLRHFGVTVEPIWIDGAIMASGAIIGLLALKSAYLWGRRRFLNDPTALPEEQLAMVSLIARDVQGIRDHLKEVQSNLRDSIHTKLEEAVGKIVDSHNDNEVFGSDGNSVQVSPPQSPSGTALRTFVALRVRDVVMEKYLDGSWLREKSNVRHVYAFGRETMSGRKIRIQLGTPYRDAEVPDARMSYFLDVWADDTKVLNFEWSRNDDTKLRFLRAGPWVDDVVSWQFEPIPVRIALQAAE